MANASLVEVQLQQPQSVGDGHHTFPKGHPRYGGRPKGRKNRFGGDLREAVVAGIQAVGFIEVVDGKRTATGLRGCQGFIEWLALNEPKTAAALFARVLPDFINVGGEVPEVMSETEMEAMLKEPDHRPGAEPRHPRRLREGAR
jgi:hypothetical protein